MTNIWDQIRRSLTEIYSMPHNQVFLKEKGWTLDETIEHKISEIRSGIQGVPKAETFLGQKTFLRVAGFTNHVYSGEWWFDAAILENLENGLSSVIFDEDEFKKALIVQLREVLAVSTEWNSMGEVWVLNLPLGQQLKGFSGFGNPQKLFNNKPLSAKGNKMLVGKVRQLYFPVKNPLWVTKYSSLI